MLKLVAYVQLIRNAFFFFFKAALFFSLHSHSLVKDLSSVLVD